MSSFNECKEPSRSVVIWLYWYRVQIGKMHYVNMDMLGGFIWLRVVIEVGGYYVGFIQRI